MSQRTYRACIVGRTGRGNYGHGLDLACRGVDRVQVVAVADEDAAGRRRAMERSGARRGYADYEEMLDAERPDLVVIAPRWVDCHEAMLLAAVRRGIHVYCEKPFVRTLAEADRVLDAAGRVGVRIAVAHQARAFPIVRQIKQMVESGAIGRLRGLRAFGKCDRRGGGQDLIALGPHVFDLMRYFGGEVAWVHAHVTSDGRDITADDVRPGEEGVGPVAGNAIHAYCAYQNGGSGTFESTVLAGSEISYLSLLLCGTRGVISIKSIGDRSVYHYPRAVVLPGVGDDWERVLPLEPVPVDESVHTWGNRVLVEDLIAAIEQGRAPLSSGADACATLELVMAIYESQRVGSRVPLPLPRREHPLTLLKERVC